MPREPLSAALPRHEILRFLQALFHDPGSRRQKNAPPWLDPITREAFTVTAASLYGWCHHADVDAALAMISMPVPTCLHGQPWNKCADCGTQRQSFAPN